MRNLFIVYLMINSHLLFAKEDTSRTEVFENDSVYCIKFYPITSGPFVNEKFVNFDAGGFNKLHIKSINCKRFTGN